LCKIQNPTVQYWKETRKSVHKKLTGMEMGPPKEPSGFPMDIVPLSHHAAAIQEEGGTWYCDEARREERDGCPYRVKEETVRIHCRTWGSQEGHIEVEAVHHCNSREMDDM
jgi:hypothetical protein